MSRSDPTSSPSSPPTHSSSTTSQSNHSSTSTSTSSSSIRIPKCQICQKKTSLYCCPRCSIRTCSLSCCQTHKLQNNCNGKRDRTAFVSLTQFSDSNLQSDFHFLEDVLTVSERVKRLGRDILGGNYHNRNHNHNNKRDLVPKRMHPPDPNNNTKNNNVVDAKDDVPVPVQPLLNLHLQETHDKHNTNTNTNTNMNEENLHNNKPPDSKKRKITTDLSSSSSTPPPPPNPSLTTNSTTNSNSNVNNWLQQHPPNLKRLVKEANQYPRKVNLLLMPMGMERRTKNKTHYKIKTDTIVWSVEWVFHHFRKSSSTSSSSNILDHNNDSSSTFIQLQSQSQSQSQSQHKIQKKQQENVILFERLKEQSILEQELSKHLHSFSQHSKQFHSIPNINQLHLFIQRVPCRSNAPTYIPIPMNSDATTTATATATTNSNATANQTQTQTQTTLQDALRGCTIVEYPTIEVVLPQHLHLFPTMVQELSS